MIQTTEIAKLVSEAWKKLTPEERKEWDDAAEKDKTRYEAEKTMYKGKEDEITVPIVPVHTTPSSCVRIIVTQLTF